MLLLFFVLFFAGIPISRICASRICASQGRGWFHGFEMRVAVVILSSAQSGREYLLGPWYEICGSRGGWWGSDKRKEAGNVGGWGYRGGLVILKATREASCNGESFGSKNASHPHNPLLILWHIYIQLYQRAARSPTWLLLQGTFAVWSCLMSFSSHVDKECFLDKKRKG